MLTNAADILVGDAFGLTDVLFGNGLVFDDNLGIGGDHHDAFWSGLHDGEGQSLSKKGHARNENPVACNHRSLGQASLSKAFDTRAEFHFLLVGHDWRDGEFCAGFCLDLSHRDAVAETDTCVLSDDSIHSNDVHFRIFGSTSPVNGCGGTLFSTDLHEITGLEVQAHFRRNTGSPEAYVGGYGL